MADERPTSGTARLMRIVIAAALVGAAAFVLLSRPEPAPAYGPRTIDIPEGALAEPLAMHLVRGAHPVVRVIVDGTHELDMLVDTGTVKTMLSPALKNSEADRSVASLCFANGVCARDLAIDFAESNYTQGARGTYNGIIGSDLLRHFAVTFDYRGGILHLRDTQATPAHAVPFAMEWKPRITLDLGGRAFSGLLLDTGASYTRLNPEMLDAVGPSRPDAREEVAFFVGKTERAQIFRLPRYCVGDACVSNLAVQAGSWGAVGATFFRRHLTTFDYPNGRLLLTPYDDPEWRPRNGVEARGVQVDILDPARVVFVEGGSAAARAGLAADDRIAALNGEPIDSLGYFGVNRLLEGEAPVTLTIGNREIVLD